MEMFDNIARLFPNVSVPTFFEWGQQAVPFQFIPLAHVYCVPGTVLGTQILPPIPTGFPVLKALRSRGKMDRNECTVCCLVVCTSCEEVKQGDKLVGDAILDGILSISFR